MRTTLFLLAPLLALACTSGGSGGGDPPEPTPTGDIAFTLMTALDNGELVPLVDGDDAQYVWGTQGGTMLRPTFELAGDKWAVGDVFDITIRHSPDPAAPDWF